MTALLIVIVVTIVVVVVLVVVVLIVFFDFTPRFEAAKQAVAFVVGTGGEVQRSGNSSPATVAERERPSITTASTGALSLEQPEQ